MKCSLGELKGASIGERRKNIEEMFLKLVMVVDHPLISSDDWLGSLLT